MKTWLVHVSQQPQQMCQLARPTRHPDVLDLILLLAPPTSHSVLLALHDIAQKVPKHVRLLQAWQLVNVWMNTWSMSADGYTAVCVSTVGWVLPGTGGGVQKQWP
jgi:hypothetical protein